MSILEYIGKEKQQYFEEAYNLLRKVIWDMEKNGTSCFVDSNNFIADEKESIFFDDVHMSDKGYKIWTRSLFLRLCECEFFEL